MKAAAELAGQVGVKPACDALGVCGATFYRRLRPMTGHQQPSPTPARALSEKEQDEVFDILCSQRFVYRSPAEVVATLVDSRGWLLVLGLGAASIGQAPLAAQERASPAGEWRYIGGDASHTRYSPLDQITAENFEELEVA